MLELKCVRHVAGCVAGSRGGSHHPVAAQLARRLEGPGAAGARTAEKGASLLPFEKCNLSGHRRQKGWSSSLLEIPLGLTSGLVFRRNLGSNNRLFLSVWTGPYLTGLCVPQRVIQRNVMCANGNQLSE